MIILVNIISTITNIVNIIHAIILIISITTTTNMIIISLIISIGIIFIIIANHNIIIINSITTAFKTIVGYTEKLLVIVKQIVETKQFWKVLTGPGMLMLVALANAGSKMFNRPPSQPACPPGQPARHMDP